jgi:hypothetical protein
LTSQTATVNEHTNDLIAKGTVVDVSDSGFSLFTEELRWDHEKSEFFRSFCTFVTPEDSLTELDLIRIGFENWVISNLLDNQRELKY